MDGLIEPAEQGRGLGRQLLRRVLFEPADVDPIRAPDGDLVQALVADSAQPISNGLYASLGIVPTVRHADYLVSWLGVLREDNRAIVRAASQASKAADWLLAFLLEAAGVAAADPDESEAAQMDRRAA